MTSLKIPEEFKDTHVQARDIYKDWYLIPLEMILNTGSMMRYECWLYKKDGTIYRNKAYLLTRDQFEL